jgi:hypothetical protein
MLNKFALPLIFISLSIVVKNTSAETNVEGDYIVILDGGSSNSEALDPSFNITPNSS